ncbi:hypothetical protein CDAR_114321 [Caerostris darwini]|uniref:Uncharacterized protein n=1 Tax=Caerostris darwini TaxID=1538125 RepID=A0AAV4T538_9ARAC|nr:hypothetical protein CDAR_114321 [Caerostris darwini]
MHVSSNVFLTRHFVNCPGFLSHPVKGSFFNKLHSFRDPIKDVPTQITAPLPHSDRRRFHREALKLGSIPIRDLIKTPRIHRGCPLRGVLRMEAEASVA